MALFLLSEPNLLRRRSIRRYLYIICKSAWRYVAISVHASTWRQPSFSTSTSRPCSMDIAHLDEVCVSIIAGSVPSSPKTIVSRSIPYGIRFRQCLVEYLSSPNGGKRPLYNAIKYATAFPVIYLSAAQRLVEVEPVLFDDYKSPIWYSQHPVFTLWYVHMIPFLILS